MVWPKNPNPHYDKIVELQRQVTSERYIYWKNEDLFTYQWWILVGIAVLSLGAWLVLLDKKKARKMLQFGSLVVILAMFMDCIGTELILWGYPHHFLYLVPLLNPVNIVALPVTYMLIYQCCSGWKKFLAVLTIFAAVFSFIAEPLLTLMDIYRLYDWRYEYSFPVYITMGVSLKWFCDWLWRENY